MEKPELSLCVIEFEYPKPDITYSISENFDTATTAAKAGVTTIYGGAQDLSVSGQMLTIPDTNWVTANGGNVFWQLVPDGTFANTPQKYLVEMDIKDLSKLGPLTFMFNGERTTADGEKVVATDRKNGMAVSIRLATVSTVNNPSNKTISAANEGGYDIFIRSGYVNASGSPAFSGGTLGYDIKSNENVSFKLGILVDSAVTGTTVSVYINDLWKCDYTATKDVTYDVKANSSIVMWAQNTVMSIDNLKITQLY